MPLKEGGTDLDQFKENFIESLRQELVDRVAAQLSPVAAQYHYSEVALETRIKWRPTVLLLGNYSSGKSTLINELLGAEVQATGQAPTDDSFTVICQADSGEEERDGQVLLHDDQYPFETLRKHGERFAAHFRLKKVHSEFLADLALIDTPGMLDSSAEKDRGYDYQEVIGDLAQIADLILVMFDPHKAGTVREAHTSLRDTIPKHTFEDRVIFVLNRIDECQSLDDMLRVYGTLCWNLSQITGRKDIPMIYLTHAPGHHAAAPGAQEFMPHLKNQREELKRKILQAPRYRLDHMASYIETHGERLAHYLEGLHSYARAKMVFRLKFFVVSLVLAVVAGLGTWLTFEHHDSLQGTPEMVRFGTTLGIAAQPCYFSLFFVRGSSYVCFTAASLIV